MAMGGRSAVTGNALLTFPKSVYPASSASHESTPYLVRTAK